MAQFLAQRAYNRVGFELKPGDVVDIPPGVALWVNRDAPGTLVEIEDEGKVDDEVKVKVKVEDRMMRGRRGRK